MRTAVAALVVAQVGSAEEAREVAGSVAGSAAAAMEAAARGVARVLVAAAKVEVVTGVAAKAAKVAERGCCHSIRRNRTREQQAASN